MHRFVFCSVVILVACAASAFAQQLLVTSPEGLNLRDAPSIDGRVLATIPAGEAVTMLAEAGDALTIQGATGKWTKVQWRDFQGWVFGGFLEWFDKGSALRSPDSGFAQWARTTLSGSGELKFNGVAVDEAENVYAAGYLGGATDYSFGDGVSVLGVSPDKNILLVKYNNRGIPQWARTITNKVGGSEFSSVAIGRNGNIYAAGYIEGKQTYNFGNDVKVTGVFQDKNEMNKSYNLLLAAYSPEGTALWARTVLIATNRSAFNSVAVDREGNVYAAGNIGKGNFTFSKAVSKISTQDSLLLVKYNDQGIARWIKTAVAMQVRRSDVFSEYIGVAVDESGNVYAVGHLGGFSVYDFGSGVSAVGAAHFGNSTNSVIVKYNSSGTALWAQSTTGGEGYSNFLCVAMDSAGNAYAAGYIQGAFMYSFGHGVTAEGLGEFQPILVKYESNGNAQWARTISSGIDYSRFNCIAADRNGNIFAAGKIGSGLHAFGPGVSVAGSYSGSGSGAFRNAGQNIVLVKYKADGDVIWARSNIEGKCKSEFTGVAVAETGNIFAVGIMAGAGFCSFSPGVTINTVHDVELNPLVVKYSQ